MISLRKILSILLLTLPLLMTAMASKLVKIPQIPTPLTKLNSSPSSSFKPPSTSLPLKHKHSQPLIIKVHSALPSSSSSSSSPPSSREAAINQAKTCLTTTLEKPLNAAKLATNKLKKLKQLRFRIEIPVVDDSPESLSQLGFDIFRGLPIKRRGSPVKIMIVWPSVAYKEAALKVFDSLPKGPVDHTDIASVNESDDRVLNSAEVAVFMACEASQLGDMKRVSDGLLYPNPVVMFNPRWAFEDEGEFGADLRDFVRSFEVIYSFMGLEVRGILSKKKGVIFKCVGDGTASGERWAVFVEEENGELKEVSKFKSRPSIVEIESVLYNLMAMNSPMTRSVKFLKGLVSNVTGKKED